MENWTFKLLTRKRIQNATRPILTVGRSSEADFSTTSTEISRKHAKFMILADGTVYVEDLGSFNGTFVNNVKIDPKTEYKLKDNDIISFGGSKCIDNYLPMQLLYVERPQGNVTIQIEDSPKVNLKKLKIEEVTIDNGNEQKVKNDSKDAYRMENSCIVILDDDDDIDDNNFRLSQISNIELNDTTLQEPTQHQDFLKIKEELECIDGACDAVNFPFVVDLSCDNDGELLNILQGSDSIEEELQAKKVCTNTQKTGRIYTKPPIIEPPTLVIDKNKSKIDTSKGKKSKEEKTKDTLGKIKSGKSKRKSTENQPEIKVKRIKTMGETLCDTKSIHNEFKKRAGKKVKDKNDTKNKEMLHEKRKEKLKELTCKPSDKPNTVKMKPNSNPKVKVTGSRGLFLLEMNDSAAASLDVKKKHVQGNEIRASYQSKTRDQCDKRLGSKNLALGSMEKNELTKSSCYLNATEYNSDNINKNSNGVAKNRISGVMCEDDQQSSSSGSVLDGYYGDMDSCFNKNYSLRKCPDPKIVHHSFEDIYQIISKWLPLWFHETEYQNHSPPVTDKTPKKMPTYFKSFKEYYDSLIPLTMLEMWQYAFQENVLGSKREPFTAEIQHHRINGSLISLDCSCYVTKEAFNRNQYSWHDLMFVAVLYSSNEKNNKKSRMYFKSMGTVVKVNWTHLKEDSLINKTLAHQCPGVPFKKLDFTVVTQHPSETKWTLEQNITLLKAANLKPYFRLIAAAKSLEYSPLLRHILHPNAEDYKIGYDKYYTTAGSNLLDMNSTQKKVISEAVQVCTRDKPGIYPIVGPPGTGKSTVIERIIYHILSSSTEEKNHCILLLAPSNAAVDELFVKLTEGCKKAPMNRFHGGLKMLRYGRESAFRKEVLGYSLTSLTYKHMFKHAIQSFSIKAAYDKLNDEVSNLSKQLENAQAKNSADAFKLSQLLKSKQAELSQENFLQKHLKKDYDNHFRMAENILMKKCNVFCTTLNSCGNVKIENAVKKGILNITCCIIDEATQATENQSLIPFRLGVEKLILVGDPAQLPATVINMKAKTLGYGDSLFTRVLANLNNCSKNPIPSLTEQYRMHKEICSFPSKTFYNNQLVTSSKIKRKLSKLKPYLLFDVEVKNSNKMEYINKSEIMLVTILLQLIESNIGTKLEYTVGIITPYSLQRDGILKAIQPLRLQQNLKLSVNTVDGFQGQEKDIIILSCVRDSSNSFLQDPNRLNVALTRAKSVLYIIGDHQLFKDCPSWYDLKEDAKSRQLLINIKTLDRNQLLAYLKTKIFCK